MSLTPRPGIMKISPYVQGLAELTNTQPVIKLSSNEAAFGPSPKAMEAYKQAASQLHRYADGSAKHLRNTLSDTYGFPADQLVCGAGSDELIALLIQSFAGAGDEVLYSQYGFLMYPISTLKVGATPVTAPESNYTTDVDAMLAAVTDRTKIVFIANPNNPTGSYISKAEVVRLRAGLPPHILLVLDSAYAEFVSRPDFSDGSEIVEMGGENTVMLRTFSKIYGLAALRLGWAYCPPSIADILNRVRGPFNISGPSMEAGIAALKDKEFIEQARQHNDEWLAIMQEALAAIGLKPYPSVANFVLVEFPADSGKNAAAADKFLQSKGIIARRVSSYGLDHCLRFTIGKAEENRAVVIALTEFMA